MQGASRKFDRRRREIAAFPPHLRLILGIVNAGDRT